ncbi:MAG TPA: hypothetical protein PK836_10545 [Syntrophales bacterium]|nr:hypothetical protein [Syntrophales bacterium]HOM08436.1 hypothetical protein [Syntrophales bacterium]HOO01000.1 hypothetical protein [Syntrophales bacterium]HPC02099.1 hypothetical protein [Syntrophales bacterium]HPQ07581.1 hypothetical protein [Syntrophales bacterium]
MDQIFVVPVGVGEMAAVEALTLPPALVETVGGAGPWHVTGILEEGSNRALWEEMAPDDLILYYRDGAIVAAATVAATAHSPDLAVRLWPRDVSPPRALLCFTDRPHEGEVPIIPPMYRYLEREYRGLTRLQDERVGYILNDYGSFEVFTRLCLRYDFPFSLRHT